MSGRGIVNFFFGIVLLILVVGIGAGVYDAGVHQGIVDAGRFPAGAAVPYGGGYGFQGFGILGLIFPIFFLFLIFGLLRAMFRGPRGGRGWGHGGWGHGWGYDHEGWQADREKHIAELHRRLHEDPTSSGNPPSRGPA